MSKITQDQIEATQPQQVVTTLSSADILALKATPIEIAPAPGANKMVVPYLIILTYFGDGATPYDTSGGGNITIGWAAGILNSFDIPNSILEATTDQYIIFDLSGSTATDTDISDIANQPLMIVNNGAGEYVDGTGTAKVTVYYNIVNLS